MRCRARRRGDERAPEQPVGPHDQHDGHRDEGEHERRLRQPPHAEGVQQADQQAREERAADRTQPADDHHDESLDDDREVHLQVTDSRGICRAPASPARKLPSAKTAVKSQRPVHAERRGHFAVLRGGAHARCPSACAGTAATRAAPKTSGPTSGRNTVYCGTTGCPDLEAALESRRARCEQVLRAPDRQHQILHDQRDAEGREQLEDLRRRVDPPQHETLDHDAGQRDRERREQQPAEERRRRGRQRGRDAEREVGAEHVERAVREVDDPRDAEDERQPAADEEQRGTVRQPGEELAEDEIQGQWGSASQATSWPRRGRRLRTSSSRRQERRAVGVAPVTIVPLPPRRSSLPT